MLQQTQVDRVLPKYQEWLVKYPTMEQLAQAPVEAREQRSVPLRRKALRELDGQHRLASSGRAGDGRALAMGHEAQDPSLIVR